jgi:hypothetical protein
MFLDQFENSVDTYRRMSRLEQQTRPRATSNDESLYSTDIMDEEEEDAETEGRITPRGEKNKANRTSTALDTLTVELDALRSKWENTSRNYKLSDRFEFESQTHSSVGRESLSTWARGLETDDESIKSEESVERLLTSASSPPTQKPPRSVPASTKH